MAIAGRAEVQEQLRRLDAQLEELRREAEQLDTTLAYLERRRDVLEDAWAAGLEQRDKLEAQLWQDGKAPTLAAPQPPDLSLAGVPVQLDPVLESWGLGGIEAPAAQWIPPAHTWPIKIAIPTGLPPRRGRQEPSPVWLDAVDTAPIWRRNGATPAPRRRPSRP